MSIRTRAVRVYCGACLLVIAYCGGYSLGLILFGL